MVVVGSMGLIDTPSRLLLFGGSANAILDELDEACNKLPQSLGNGSAECPNSMHSTWCLIVVCEANLPLPTGPHSICFVRWVEQTGGFSMVWTEADDVDTVFTYSHATQPHSIIRASNCPGFWNPHHEGLDFVLLCCGPAGLRLLSRRIVYSIYYNSTLLLPVRGEGEGC